MIKLLLESPATSVWYRPCIICYYVSNSVFLFLMKQAYKFISNGNSVAICLCPSYST